MSGSFEQEILQRLTAIETKMDSMTFNPATCAVHTRQLDDMGERLGSVERQQGKQNLVAMTMGVVGTGLAFVGKYLFTRGSV